MNIRLIVYISVIIFTIFLLYTIFMKAKHKHSNINLPYNNIFCKDKTIKEFAKDKICQSLIDDYCQCYYNANCNLAYNVKNQLVNFARVNDKYYLHIIQQKEYKTINVIYELDSNLYIKSIKCIAR